MKFSIVIPVYNEEQLAVQQVALLIAHMKKTYPANGYEILLVQNGSTDGTKKSLRQLTKKYRQVRVIHLAEASYGNAVKEGLRRAKYDTIFRFDIEFWSVPFIHKSLHLLKRNSIIVGSKNLPASRHDRHFSQKIVSGWINSLLRSVFTIPFTDSHGLKCYNRKRIMPFLNEVESPNHFFETELLIRGHYKKLGIKEVPVSIRELRKSRFPFLRRVGEAIVELYKLCQLRHEITHYAPPSQRRLRVLPSYR